MQADNKKFEEALINEILSSKTKAEAKLLTKVYIMYLSTLINDDEIKTEPNCADDKFNSKSTDVIFTMERRS